MQLAGSNPTSPPDAEHGVSVLLVEDESAIAEPFSRALIRSGFRTTVARTGAEAIAFMPELRPDVVLLDLALPDIDGRDVCRRLRQDWNVPMSDVWDVNWFGSTKTLDVHIAWLRRKLGDDPGRARLDDHRGRVRLCTPDLHAVPPPPQRTARRCRSQGRSSPIRAFGGSARSGSGIRSILRSAGR